MSKKEKIYLNGVPVYRYTDMVELGPSIKYVLFEDNEEIGHVLFLQMFLTRSEEYQIVLDSIKRILELDKENKINVRVVEYGQDRRSNEWVLKPSQKQTRVVVKKTV
tara:strand:+ start:12856 stop:13176 length:321 start_codon:yes stop_codon:yes gene_type:complete